MTPKIDFEYSWVYDDNWKKCIRIYEKKKEPYPSYSKIISYIAKVEKLWRINEKKILNELSRVSGLKWKSKAIKCYVVGRCIPFSDPLTMPVYLKHPDFFIDMLIHELIHQLFTQKGNSEKSKKAWDYVYGKYKKQSITTKIHIPLHAIHSHIYLKFFNKKRLEDDIASFKSLPDYRKSWEIVQKEGYENIIREFKKRVG